MLPRERRGTATPPRARVSSGSYSKMYSSGTATATLAAAPSDALAATLSIRDVQRCFEKERRAFLSDLESLRQQLVKKDAAAAKAATIASQHAIQLKKEIASLQAALSASEKEAAKHEQQFRHTSALLETALDQHQADHAKLAELTETLRTMERKHDDALAVVKKEAAASIQSTHEERKALRARVDQLRAKLDAERKEFMALKTPLNDDLAKASVRLSVLEKELGESRYRETASVQLKDKMQSEVVQYKRKVADLSTALQEALTAKSDMKAAHQLTMGKMKEKWRDVLAAHAQSREQLVMLQEDYNGLFRSRARTIEHAERVAQSLRTLKQRHEQQLKEKDNEYWDLEKRFKRNSATCTVCMKTPEQRQEILESQMAAVRDATRLEVVKEMELERWDRFQDINAKYMDVSSQLQASMRDGDALQRELKGLLDAREELQRKEKKLVEMLSRAERRVQDLERQASDDAQTTDEHKRQIQELMKNLSKMTTVTADQSKQLHDLERARREEVETLKVTIATLEAEKQQLAAAKNALQQQLDDQLDAFEQLKTDKAKQWNEIMSAQLSANLLIEEQAHTIDTLLKKSRHYMSPSKSQSTSSPSPNAPRSEREPSGASSDSQGSPTGGGGGSATVAVLRHECELLRDELTNLQARHGHDKETLQTEYEQKVVELLRELKTLERDRAKLKRRVDEQAVTIHELTLQEDEEDEEEEEEEANYSDDEYVDERDARVVPSEQRPRSSEAIDWSTPKRRPSRAQPPAPSMRIRRALKDVVVESDEDATVGLSFLSTTFS